MQPANLGLALTVVALLAGQCQPRLGMLEVPGAVQAGSVFSITVHGNDPWALGGGGVGCVVQLPNSVTIQGFTGAWYGPSSMPVPVTRDDPALLGLYTAEPGHYLASFSSSNVWATNAALTLLLQAPATASGSLAVKTSIAGDVPALWTVNDPYGVTDFAAIGGAHAKTFVLVPDPPLFERTADGLPGDLGEVAFGDVDGDGNDDLVGMTATTTGAVLSACLSRPGAPFTVVQTAVTPIPLSSAVALGDFDGDRHLDAALAGQVWFGDGLGGFVPGPTLTLVGPMSRTAVGDADGDGIDDAAFVGQTTIAQVFRSNGNRTFTDWSNGLPSQPVNNQYFSWAVLLHDVTHDGFADLVVARHEANQRIDVFPGDGQGNWTGPAAIPTAGGAQQIAVGDLTGDGIDELVVAVKGQLLFQAFQYQGSLQWAAAPLPPVAATWAAGLALLDFDRDGRLDVAATDSPSFGTFAMWNRMRLLRNTGGGMLVDVADSGLTACGAISLRLATGDLDGNTFPDLAATLYTGAASGTMRHAWRNMSTGVAKYGAGCSALGHAPFVATTGQPQLGNGGFLVHLHDGASNGGGLLWLGFSKRYAFGLPQLPFDLTGFGAPGCTLLAEPYWIRFLLLDPQGLATQPLPLPNVPALRFTTLFAQGAVLVPAANPLGALFSGGLAVRLD